MKTVGKPIGIALIILMMISVQAFAQSNGNGASGGNVSQVMAKNTQTIGTGGGGNGGNANGVYGTDEGGEGTGNCNTVRIREREQTRARIQMHLLSDADPVLIEGMVIEVLYSGSALIVATEDPENPTTVYGIGPQWYWDMLGVSKPDVGEEVSIEALLITFSDGTERIIATTIYIPGEEPVVLRDEYGWPVWRQVGYGLEQ